MRFIAFHDAEGEITAIVSYPDGGPEPVLVAAPGELSSSIAVPDGVQADSDELTPEEVQRIAGEYRVEPSTEMGVLAPREGSGEGA